MDISILASFKTNFFQISCHKIISLKKTNRKTPVMDFQSLASKGVIQAKKQHKLKNSF